MKVTFVRHGQTEWNRLGKQQGLADIPLDQTGIEQARKTAQLLKDEAFDCVYCSPLKRAQQTAQIICEGRNIPIILEQRLIERDMGEFEGMTWHQFDTRAFWDYTADLHYRKAENIRDFDTAAVAVRCTDYYFGFDCYYPYNTLLIISWLNNNT